MSDDDKTVIKEVKFNRPPPKQRPMPETPEQANPTGDAEFDAFAEGFKRLRAPSEDGFPAINVEIMGHQRIARSMYDQGYRFHPELAAKKWLPTPGMGENSSFDGGKFYERNEDGTWPIESVEAELDLDDIVTEPMVDGTWAAIHTPSQTAAQGPTKLAATRALMDQLDALFNGTEGDDTPAE